MKESMWGYLIVLLGLVIVVVIFLVSNLTNTNEQDYFLAREILRDSMYDAVDYGTYMKSGKLVMSKEKFVSVFTRRFAESVNNDRTYTLEFYDIYEYPPKATVRIQTKTGTYSVHYNPVNVEINTFLSGILETSVSRGDYSVVFKSDLGDCNGDGNFSDNDLPEIEKYIENKSGTCDDNFKEGQDIYTRLDINGDHEITKTDLILLKKYLYRGTPLDMNADGEFNSDDVGLVVADCKNVGANQDYSLLTERQKVIADANSNGEIDSVDRRIYCRCIGAEDVDGDGDTDDDDITCFMEDANQDGEINNEDLIIINNCLNKGKCDYQYWDKKKYLYY